VEDYTGQHILEFFEDGVLVRSTFYNERYAALTGKPYDASSDTWKRLPNNRLRFGQGAIWNNVQVRGDTLSYQNLLTQQSYSLPRTKK
jgi:hypothetical protein